MAVATDEIAGQQGQAAVTGQANPVGAKDKVVAETAVPSEPTPADIERMLAEAQAQITPHATTDQLVQTGEHPAAIQSPAEQPKTEDALSTLFGVPTTFTAYQTPIASDGPSEGKVLLVLEPGEVVDEKEFMGNVQKALQQLPIAGKYGNFKPEASGKQLEALINNPKADFTAEEKASLTGWKNTNHSTIAATDGGMKVTYNTGTAIVALEEVAGNIGSRAQAISEAVRSGITETLAKNNIQLPPEALTEIANLQMGIVPSAEGISVVFGIPVQGPDGQVALKTPQVLEALINNPPEQFKPSVKQIIDHSVEFAGNGWEQVFAKLADPIAMKNYLENTPAFAAKNESTKTAITDVVQNFNLLNETPAERPLGFKIMAPRPDKKGETTFAVKFELGKGVTAETIQDAIAGAHQPKVAEAAPEPKDVAPAANAQAPQGPVSEAKGEQAVPMQRAV